MRWAHYPRYDQMHQQGRGLLTTSNGGDSVGKNKWLNECIWNRYQESKFKYVLRKNNKMGFTWGLHYIGCHRRKIIVIKRIHSNFFYWIKQSFSPGSDAIWCAQNKQDTCDVSHVRTSRMAASMYGITSMHHHAWDPEDGTHKGPKNLWNFWDLNQKIRKKLLHHCKSEGFLS